MKIKIELKDDVVEFLNNYATIVTTEDGETYYYTPFWFKETEDPNMFEQFSLGSNFPESLKVHLSKERNTVRPIPFKLRRQPMTPDECLPEKE